MKNKVKFKNNIKITDLIIGSVIIFLFLISIILLKTFAFYKLENEYNILKSKVGSYQNGDATISALVDGKETDSFPEYTTNYKVTDVNCSNGVKAYWNVENWELRISDMSSTSTKCTVNFDSTQTNETTPINYSKEELLELNNTYQNTTINNVKSGLLDAFYPVGSIYLSVTDDTVDKVATKFGGTWVKYSEGRMLVGANSSYPVNSTGGSSSVTLSTTNLPNHSHTYTPAGSVSSSFSGTAVNTTTNGNHSHTVYGIWAGGMDSGVRLTLQGDGNVVVYSTSGALWSTGTQRTGNSYRTTTVGSDGTTSTNGNHYHQFTASGSVSSSFSGSSSNTTGCTNCNSSAINVQNPYTAVYMYKRTA